MKDKGFYKPLEFKKKLAIGVLGYVIGVLVLWLFYERVFVLLPAFLVAFLFSKTVQSAYLKKQRHLLRVRFLDVLSSLSAALEAGESAEGAMLTCLKDLSLMYKQKDAVVAEFREIVRKLGSNRSVEEALLEFAERTGEEEILRFADVFAITKRSGGDLLSVIRASSHTLAEKEEVQRQIGTIISAKRFEAAIMAVMPIGIILYFQIVDKSFLNPLYSGLTGGLVMTVLLAAYLGCLALILKITDIKV